MNRPLFLFRRQLPNTWAEGILETQQGGEESAEMLWDVKLWGGLASVSQRGKSLNRVWGGQRGEVAGGKRLVEEKGGPRLGERN